MRRIRSDLKENPLHIGGLLSACLCDQADWSNNERVTQVKVKPNRRTYALIFRVCSKCRYVVGLEDPDPDDKLDRYSETVRTIAKLLNWKINLRIGNPEVR